MIADKRTRIIAGGVVAVLLFDLIASVASRELGFSYTRASVGSYFIYLITGAVAARAASKARARQGAIAAAIVGFADVTAGWAISWVVGPGKVTNETLTPLMWLTTMIVVVLFAGAVGFLGGAVGARSKLNAP